MGVVQRQAATADDAPCHAAEVAPLLRRLRSVTALLPGDVAIVESLALRSARDVPPRTEMHREGDYAVPTVILSGWACSVRTLPDGRRQIMSFLLPGDIVGKVAPRLPSPFAAVALTRVRVADAMPLYETTSGADPTQPGLAQGLYLLGLLNEALLGDQITRLGRQTAYERFGNLLLELYHRLHVVGLARDGRFALPLTQEMLADALGLSVVHVNRTVQQMRRDGLLELRAGTVVIPALETLRAASDWEPFRTTLQAG